MSSHAHAPNGRLIQFPSPPAAAASEPCGVDPQSCPQSERIARLEERESATTQALKSIDEKLDRLQWWILGLAVTIAGAAVSTLITILIIVIFKASPHP